MGVDEGNLQIIDIDTTLENCSVTIVILNWVVVNYRHKTYIYKERKEKDKNKGKRHSRVHPGHLATQQSTHLHPA